MVATKKRPVRKKKPKGWIGVSAVVLASLLITILGVNAFNQRPVTSTVAVAGVIRGFVICDDGSTCAVTESIFSDGRFEEHDPLTEKEVSKLKALIEASDLDNEIRAKVSNDCDTASSADKIGFTFPSKYKGKIFKPCAISNPQLNELIAYMMALNSSKTLTMK